MRLDCNATKAYARLSCVWPIRLGVSEASTRAFSRFAVIELHVAFAARRSLFQRAALRYWADRPLPRPAPIKGQTDANAHQALRGAFLDLVQTCGCGRALARGRICAGSGRGIGLDRFRPGL